MRSVLIGPGAIGGTVATLITNAGFPLDVVCENETYAAQFREQGFHLSGARGEHTVKLNTMVGIENLEPGYDICIISTKAFIMPKLARDMLPKLKPDSIVVCMQNGICTDLLAEVVGDERTVSCMIGFGATMHAQGDVEMTSLGEFAIGYRSGESNEKLEYLRDMMNAVLPTTISKNITGDLFSKLIINSCINSLGGLTGVTLGTMLNDKRARVLFLAVAREGIRVAKAMKIEVPAFNGILNYNLLLFSQAKLYDFICETLFRIVGKLKYSSVKVSTLQTLERGEKTEIDYFNGYLAKMGAQHGVATPICAQLTEMIHQIERGERKIAMENLYDVKL